MGVEPMPEDIEALWAAHIKIQSNMSGPMNTTVVSTCLAINRRVFARHEITNLLLECEEEFGVKNLFGSVYKIDFIGTMLGQHGEVNKSVWMLRHLQDMMRTNSLDKMDQSVRGLGGKGLPNGKGKMHVVLFKYDVMVHLMERVLESSPIAHQSKESIRGTFKSHHN